MSTIFIISIIANGLAFLCIVLFVMSKIISSRIRRRESDKPIIESHRMLMRPPTWKFQKHHPSRCPHHNGIYRKVLAGNDKKTIFVCADCVDAIEAEEIGHRDRFKQQI